MIQTFFGYMYSTGCDALALLKSAMKGFAVGEATFHIFLTFVSCFSINYLFCRSLLKVTYKRLASTPGLPAFMDQLVHFEFWESVVGASHKIVGMGGMV